MTLKSINGNTMKLSHTKRNGKTREITVTTDAQSRSFIKKNIDSIMYDTTNQMLRFRETDGSRRPLANVIANEVYGKDIYKVTFEDGDCTNLTKRNLN